MNPVKLHPPVLRVYQPIENEPIVHAVLHGEIEGLEV